MSSSPAIGFQSSFSPEQSPTLHTSSHRAHSPSEGSPSSPHPHASLPLQKQASLDTQYNGTLIPPSTKDRKKHRTLILCFDGTGDQFDNDNSSIVNFFSFLAKGQSKQQLVYYQAGIGTYTIPQIASPFMSKVRKTLDMMFGSSLNNHVMGGYEFLMENFRRGDKICIFGFSRGAYTARAIAGMIEKVGLLPAGNHQQVPFAYKMYMKDDELGWQQSVLFKRDFSMNVEIEFVGVWDTVDSVGILPKHVPFTKNNTCVKTFRHAISLDEHRVKFKANLYDKVITQETRNADFSYTPVSQVARNFKQWLKSWTSVEREAERIERVVRPNIARKDKFNKGSQLQERYTDQTKKTDVLEVWFAGCHTDVGGGSVVNATRFSLARIPLRWMIRQCFLTQSGIQFCAGRLHEVGLDPRRLYPTVAERPPPLPVSTLHLPEPEREAGGCLGRGSRKGRGRIRGRGVDDANHTCENCIEDEVHEHMVVHIEEARCEYGEEHDEDLDINEEHEELHDALSPIFDQLALKWAWWILEWIPFVHRHSTKDGNYVKVVSINHGRPRVVTQQDRNGIKVHRSVKMRMEADARALGHHYNPRVKFAVEPTWVD